MFVCWWSMLESTRLADSDDMTVLPSKVSLKTTWTHTHNCLTEISFSMWAQFILWLMFARRHRREEFQHFPRKHHSSAHLMIQKWVELSYIEFNDPIEIFSYYQYVPNVVYMRNKLSWIIWNLEILPCSTISSSSHSHPATLSMCISYIW